jgi:hypothetical protein
VQPDEKRGEHRWFGGRVVIYGQFIFCVVLKEMADLAPEPGWSKNVALFQWLYGLADLREHEASDT